MARPCQCGGKCGRTVRRERDFPSPASPREALMESHKCGILLPPAPCSLASDGGPPLAPPGGEGSSVGSGLSGRPRAPPLCRRLRPRPRPRAGAGGVLGLCMEGAPQCPLCSPVPLQAEVGGRPISPSCLTPTSSSKRAPAMTRGAPEGPLPPCGGRRWCGAWALAGLVQQLGLASDGAKV